MNLIRQTARRARDAAARIREHVVKTPLRQSATYSDQLDARVFFKLENLQETGSFKLRGATNRLLTLSKEQRAKGCVAASSGNHGAAVACAMQKLGCSGTIFVPQQTSSAKVEKIQQSGGHVEFFGNDGLDTEQHARVFAEDNSMTYLSPYNDEEVIAGQGTCGVEIIEQLSVVDVVFVAVGGGGLIGGVGAVLKAHNPDIRVFGCQPAASAVMAHSIRAGEILDLPSDSTLSDGTAGGIEAGAITFALNQAVVDDFVVVDESDIAAAMRQYMEAEDQVIEGAAGVAIAALTKRAGEITGKNVVVVVCGSNISADVLATIQAAI